MDLFDVIAHEDSRDRTNVRVATAVSQKRYDERYLKFIESGKTYEERLARFAHIKDEAINLVTATAQEYGVDSAHIVEAVVSAPKAPAQEKTASVHEARRPKLCPYHKEVMDISLAQGEPRAGFDAMAQHAWSANHCQGPEYEGSKCNFRREMTTQSYWDEKEEQRQERAEQRERERAEGFESEQPVEDEVAPAADSPEEVEVTETPELELVEDTGSDLTEDLAEAPSAVGEGVEDGELAVAASADQDSPLAEKTAASWDCAACGQRGNVGEYCNTCHESRSQAADGIGDYHQPVIAEALETVDLTKDSEGPVPKIDKSKVPEGGQKVVDTEGEGSPHPTRRKDIVDPIEVANDDKFEETDAVLEKQDVEKADPVSPSSGKWPSSTQANPVTNENPITSGQTKEALSAKDFVLIAHILATSPGGPNPEVAQHFATYLSQTNPLFDADRFLAAAGGTPNTGRDTFKGEDPNAGTAPGLLAAADVTKNPVREILLEEDADFADEASIQAALARKR